jgi:ribose 5-phosphate isomerase B
MKIAIASDHAGYELKSTIISHLFLQDNEVLDLGTDSPESMDYPDVVHPLASVIERGHFNEESQVEEYDLGILICGSANGVAMTANKHEDIRAAICWDVDLAKLARQHNNANVVCLPARFITEEKAIEIVDAFLNTQFEGGRHEKRVCKISIPH